MQVRQSLLPYLFTLCALCSVIAQDGSSQDASSQDTTTDPDALGYLSYLNKNYFEGQWTSTSTTQIFGKFEEHSGFFTSKTVPDCIKPFTVAFTVYDGRYIDGDSLDISLCHKFSSFHFDAENISFIGTNVSLKVSGTGITHKNCPSDVSIYFFESESDSNVIDTKFVISSSDCAFSITTDVLTLASVFGREQEGVFTFVYSLLLVIDFGFFFCIMNSIDNSVDRMYKISTDSFYWKWAWAFFLCFINIIYHVHGEQQKPLSPIFFTIIHFLINIILIVIVCVAFTLNLYDDDAKKRGLAWVFGMIVIWCISLSLFNPPWAYFSSCLYFLPQIIKNHKSKEEYKFCDFTIHLIFLPSQLFFLGYFWMNPDNFAKLTPNPIFFYTYFGFILLQVIILFFQSRKKISRYQIQSNEMAHVESEHHAESPQA